MIINENVVITEKIYDHTKFRNNDYKKRDVANELKQGML